MRRRPERSLFEVLRDRCRLRLRLSGSMRGLSALLPLLTVAALAEPLPSSLRILLVLAAFILAALAVVRGFRRALRVGTGDIARHLDHAYPALEQSAELLLVPPERLNPLQRLQRARIEPRLRALGGRSLLPRSAAGASAGLLAGSILISFLIPWVGAGLIASGALPGGEANTEVPPPIAAPDGIGTIRILVTPPAYTGLPPRESSRLDVTVEEGSCVLWTIRPDPPADGARILFEEETLDLEESPAGGFTGGLRASESRIYQVSILHGDEQIAKSDHARLQVKPDRPPEVSFVTPERDQVVDPGAELKVEAEFRDDHGLGEAAVVATLASGAGEMVRFRQIRLPLAPELSGKEGRAARTMDLAGLGMEPGSELYIHAEARDRRSPEPNVGRSRTLTIRMPGPETMTVSLGRGLPILEPPEFLRSQRQIIIDTENLIADRAGIGEAEFQFRSQAIGRDQSLLRVRYGSLLGLEVEDGRVAGVDDEKEHDEHATGHEEGEVSATVSIYPESFTHLHDSEETLAFFPDPVRRTFRQMLDRMWRAEGLLRTYQPEEALPFEHEALKLLKSIQEQARIYVNKVGFETSPLTPDKDRLSGDLSEIDDATARRRSDGALPAMEIRRALACIRRSSPLPLSQTERAALELARARLRAGALEGSGSDLRALDQLGRLLEGREGAAGSTEMHFLEEALWGLLPVPMPPARARSQRGGLLQRTYARDLERGS